MRAQYELCLRESRQPSGEVDLADLAAIGTAVEADAPPPDAPRGVRESAGRVPRIVEQAAALRLVGNFDLPFDQAVTARF